MTAVLDFFSTDRWSNLANTGTAGCQHRVAEEYHPYGNKPRAFFFFSAGEGEGGRSRRGLGTRKTFSKRFLNSPSLSNE